jgi:hypothetical protein
VCLFVNRNADELVAIEFRLDGINVRVSAAAAHHRPSRRLLQATLVRCDPSRQVRQNDLFTYPFTVKVVALEAHRGHLGIGHGTPPG